MKTKRRLPSKGKAKKAAARRLLRESDILTDRERVMARLARLIGRGHDAIYHGTRAPKEVLRSGKLMPYCDGISFSRSPEVAAYFANLKGCKRDQYSPALLVLDRRSLVLSYRLEPWRYDEKSLDDEREEVIWDRPISFRRHLLGVVRESEVRKILGPPKRRFYPLSWSISKRMAFRRKEYSVGKQFVQKGRATVRDIIIRDRKRISMENARLPAASTVPHNELKLEAEPVGVKDRTDPDRCSHTHKVPPTKR